MNNILLKKSKNTVSTVILLAVLTLMLTACRSNDNPDTGNASNTKKDDALNTSLENTEEYEDVKDGDYILYLSLSGGSGKASITSPSKASVQDGKATLTIEWSSKNYDYMIVAGQKYLPVNESGNSVFEIPIDSLDGEITVIADTVAMDTPHEIEYIISYSQNEAEIETEADAEDTDSTFVNTKTDNKEIADWISNHTLTGKLEREYAERFAISYYDDKYCLIVINETDYYIVNGDGYSIPSDIPDGVTSINIPLNNIDIVSQSTVDYFDCLNALDCASFSSINPKNSDNEKIKDLINKGKIKYAGKYSAPDYELLLSENCSLVIENTMITHTPDVLDELHTLGITTLIDYSSHETSPLGRMEWIKLYGFLCGKLSDAETVFNDKASDLDTKFAKNGNKVAYFYISENGGICVRKNQDYIVNLIELAGGNYAFSGLSEYDGTGQMTIQKEAFYEQVLDCDVLIYNSTINGSVTSKEELISKCEVLKNTKAYETDNIYCTRDNIYLSVMKLPDIADELNQLLCDRDPKEFFYKVK